jgi:hypothetical protein
MAYTTVDNPELYFQCKTYTGNGSADHSITLDGTENMQPDLVWVKVRDNTDANEIYDAVRGVQKRLTVNTTAAEGTQSNGVTAFNSDGFTVGAWNWKAGTTSGISGSPSITPSGYSFNQTAGFSIIAYTGNNTVGATIPHGLGVAPAVIIFKRREANNEKWSTYHHKNTSAPETDHLELNDSSATSDDDSILNDTAPSSTLITMKTSDSVNANSIKYVAYCFSEIKGYSKHGSYTGNGNADGAYVHLGFRPAWILIKVTSTANDWILLDNKRDSFNVATKKLNPNLNDAESNDSGVSTDFLSNGFKIRTAGGNVNQSSATFVYMAFAESPFVNSNGVPTNAR